MKNLVIALGVAMSLSAYAAPQACAQTAADYMTSAAAKYGNAINQAQNGFNSATPGSGNWTACGLAHDSFLAAQSDAKTSAYYYALGNFTSGNYYAGLARQNSHDGEKSLNDILFANKGSKIVLQYAQNAVTAAGHGDDFVADVIGY